MNKFLYLAFTTILIPLLLIGKEIKKEIIEGRDINVKKYQISNNRFQVELSSRPMHYIDNIGHYEDIKLKWLQDGTSYINRENTFITRVDLQTIKINTRQNINFHIQDFKLNSGQLIFQNFLKSQTNQIICSSNNNEQLILEAMNGALKLMFKNLKPTDSGLKIKFKISDVRFNTNSVRINNGRLIINERFFLTPPQVKIGDKYFNYAKFELVKQSSNSIIVGISIDIKYFNTISSTVSILTTLIEKNVFLGVNEYYSVDNNGTQPNITGDNDNLIIGDSDSKYRTLQLFNLFSYLPEDVTIKGAEHKITLESNQPDKSIEVVRVTGIIPGTDGQTVWTTIGSSSTDYDTFKPSDCINNIYTKNYSEGDAFCTYIENDNNDDNIYYFGIGIRLDEEDTNYIEFESSLSLKVTYEVDANITVQNEFTGGYVFVDDMINEKVAPYYAFKESGDQISLKAIDEQDEDNYIQHYKHWLKPGNVIESNIQFTDPITNNDVKIYTAHFNRQFNLDIENSFLEGGSGGQVIISGQPENSPNTSHVIEENNLTVEAISQQTIQIDNRNILHNFIDWDDQPGINWGNQMPYPQVSRIFTPDDHDDIDLLFKAHLHTDQQNDVDTKNQRRLITNGNVWIMVYESDGDIWLTASDDAGQTWCKEERLNIRQGYGFNPSLSNINSLGSNDNNRYIVSWLEQDGTGTFDLHLQTMRLSGDWLFYGWSGGDYNGRVDEENHRIFDVYIFNRPRYNARPVLFIENSGDDLILNIASEGSSTGILISRIRFDGNGFDSINDLNNAVTIAEFPCGMIPSGSLGFTREVSTSANDKLPVFIEVSPTYGGPEKLYIYYANIFQNRTFTQYDIFAKSKTTISIPTQYYGIYSMQGSASDNAYFALSIRSASYGNPTVLVYHAPSYSSAPYLRDAYVGYIQPAFMVEQHGGFNSGSPYYTVMMKSNSQNQWYKSGGSALTAIGGDVSGIFARAEVPVNDQQVIYSKTYSSPPSMLKKYSGSGQLQKGSLARTDIKAIRYWLDGNGSEYITELDFSGVKTEIIESLEKDDVLAAVKIIQTSEDGCLVSQPDTNITTLAVDVLRSDKCIASYRSSAWQELSQKSLSEFKTGDILLFRLDKEFKRLWSYKEFHYNVSAVDEISVSATFENLNPIDEKMAIFPNPFNPLTNFKISLPELSHVDLKIYNSLGQLVGSLIDRELEAGVTIVQFNGSHLSSGLYLYRLSINNKFKTGKLLLIK